MELGNYSKLYGSLIGGVFGVLVSRLGLPAELASPDIQSAVIVLMSGLFTYAFPRNKP